MGFRPLPGRGVVQRGVKIGHCWGCVVTVARSAKQGVANWQIEMVVRAAVMGVAMRVSLGDVDAMILETLAWPAGTVSPIQLPILISARTASVCRCRTGCI